MEESYLFCSLIFDICKTKTEWKFYLDSATSIAGLVVGPIGLYKIIIELRRIAEQRIAEKDTRESAARLKRIEFFLAQHRRLFDDKDLSDVLSKLDGDSQDLANLEYWDKKRKFLTFIEEIALLSNSNQFPKHIAYYMFGYYAVCALDGDNFKIGISLEPENWEMFFHFSEQSKAYRKNRPAINDLIF